MPWHGGPSEPPDAPSAQRPADASATTSPRKRVPVFHLIHGQICRQSEVFWPRSSGKLLNALSVCDRSSHGIFGLLCKMMRVCAFQTEIDFNPSLMAMCVPCLDFSVKNTNRLLKQSFYPARNFWMTLYSQEEVFNSCLRFSDLEETQWSLAPHLGLGRKNRSAH